MSTKLPDAHKQHAQNQIETRYFESDSQHQKIGRRVIRSSREVVLFHVLILVFSFFIGTVVFTKIGNSKAATVSSSSSGTIARPFASDSLWNTLIPSATNWSSSSKLSNGHSWVNDEDYSIPVVIGKSTDPLVNVTVPASWGWSGGVKQVHVPSGVTGANGTDGTIVVISDNIAHNFWQFNRTSSTVASAQSYAAANIGTDSGFGSTNPFKAAGIRAAGSSAYGGLILGTDISSGKIDHALAVSLLPTLLKSGWVYPAIAEDGGNSYSGSIPMGSRLGIPSGTAMPSGLSTIGKMIWNALQTYGAFVVDQNYGDSPVIFYADPFSVDPSAIDPLRVWWEGGSDLDQIMPYVKFTTNNPTSPPITPPPSPAPPPPPPAAPVVTISASPSSMQSGSSSTLTWSVTNSPSSCTASGDWSGSKAASGSQNTGTLSTVKNYTYTLTCSNSGGSDNASATVAVSATLPPPPAKPVVTMSVSPATINRGGSSTIAWSATNSPSSCTASGDWSGSKAASGSQNTGKITKVGSYTYSLTCSNAGGSTTGSVGLVVIPNKPTVKLSASPSTITTGQASSLSWATTEDPSSCTASGDWSGSKNTVGGTESTGTLSDATSKTYTLICSNSGGSASDSVTISISTPDAPLDPTVDKPTVSLTATPSTIQSGQQATLTWKVSGADACDAEGGWSGSKKAAGGTENSPNLTEGTTYTIVCSNSGGSTSESVSVSVVAIDSATGEVKVNNMPVDNLKVSNPAIVGKSKAGEEYAPKSKSSASANSQVSTGVLSTSKAKITAAGAFAVAVTAISGGIFAGQHYLHWQLITPFRRLFRRGGPTPGGGPPGMISG